MDDTDYEKLLNQLIRLEGSKLAPYADVEGRLIVADARYAESAGVSGRTVAVLEADVRRVAGELHDQWPGFGALDAVRQRVVIHMAFSMRVTGLLAMGRLVAALELGHWEEGGRGDSDFALGETRQAAGPRVGRNDAHGAGRTECAQASECIDGYSIVLIESCPDARVTSARDHAKGPSPCLAPCDDSQGSRRW